MDKKKIISYLGFAQKAGKIIYGADNVLKKKKLYPLVIICSSASDRTKKDIASFCGNAPLVEVEDLSSLMNKNGVKHIWQYIPNSGHESTAIRPHFYNFAKTLFKAK